MKNATTKGTSAKDRLENLKSTTAQALFERDFKPRQIIIEPWLRTEETAVIWADTGVGKTMLCLSVALAVAGGGSVADWTTSEPRKVLYIDGEMHLQDMKERLEILFDSPNILQREKQKKDALANLEILARQDQTIGAPFFDLTSKESQKVLINRVVRDKVELLILDNFTTLSEGLDDENDSTSFKQVQDFFLQLKRAGIATVLVHHSNKQGKAMRGSTALAATFEAIIGLEKPRISSPGQAKFVAKFNKFRGKGDERLADRTWSLGDDGWLVSEANPEDPSDDPTLAALKSLQFTSRAQIAEELGVNKSTVTRRIQQWEKLGILKEGEADELFSKASELETEWQRSDLYGDEDEAF
ncbi:AAA family ATPase [Celeribacter naphthalenivorans]|uniref:AAA family ATPase n=1 Tax=Celeribacter naphthalenivorans TaxID=1614694 RepID=UPI001CFA5295|nr:AAA family ATPase [Celeribacter naphthalenivorans]